MPSLSHGDGKRVPALFDTASSYEPNRIDFATACEPRLTVERRIATALWNQDERDRIIAMKAYELFCSRGCDGSDLDDWLSAARELSWAADDVLVTRSEAGFEISIAEHAQHEHIFLSIAPSSLLVLWTGGGTNSGEQTPISTDRLFVSRRFRSRRTRQERK